MMDFTRIALSETEFEEDRLEVLLEWAKRFGIGWVELWLPQCLNGGRTFDDVKRLLEERNIKACCVSTWTQLNIDERLREKQELILESIRLAKFLGTDLVNTYSGHTEGKNLKSAIDTYAQRIKPALDAAEQTGVTVVLENEFDTTGTDFTRRADTTLELVERINHPRFKLNFDASNFYIAGEEAFPYAYDRLRPHIAYVHLKGAARRQPGQGQEKSSRVWQDASGDYLCVPFGEGAVNFDGLLRRLEADAYHGFLSLEPHLSRAYLDEGIRSALDFLKRIR